MLIHHKYYGVTPIIIVCTCTLLFLCSGCSSCPGSQNPGAPRFYDAIDFMKYDASEHCILSKANSYSKEDSDAWITEINDKDRFLFTIKNGSMNYFKLNHFADYEKMRELYWKYMKYFRKYSRTYYKYPGQPTFTGDYLKWNFTVNLSENSLQIVAHVRELSIH